MCLSMKFWFQAFKSICDLLVIFSDVLASINPIYKKLHYISTAEQQAVLNGFVQHYVFATQEEGLCRFTFIFHLVLIIFGSTEKTKQNNQQSTS